jgi:alpha-L-fucosidase
VGTGTQLKNKIFSTVSWNVYPDVKYIDVLESEMDKYYTALAVVLNGKISLCREKMGAIESN